MDDDTLEPRNIPISMDMPQPISSIPPTSGRSGNPPGLIALTVISVLIALGVTGYFLTRPAPEAAEKAQTNINGTATTAPSSVDVAIFNHVVTDTTKSGADDGTTSTFLQYNDDETIYCSKFDEATDGATVANLTTPAVSDSLYARVGDDAVAAGLIEKLSTLMAIDNGLLTDACNHNGDIWVLVLSSDLQTMTPYHLTSADDGYHLGAYNPFLTIGGYAAMYFDYVPGRTVIGTGTTNDSGALDWAYYILDTGSAATDLIESCERDAATDPEHVTLDCSREYIPE